MKKLLVIINVLVLFFGCVTKTNKVNISVNSVQNNEDIEFYDGIYCAEVEYHNPSTGTSNKYVLDVEVEGGELTKIHWPNSGWLDYSHFSPEDITSGECELFSDKGYRFNIVLGDFGGCGFAYNHN